VTDEPKPLRDRIRFGPPSGQQLNAAGAASVPPPATEVPPPPPPPAGPPPGYAFRNPATFDEALALYESRRGAGSYSATLRGPEGYHADVSGSAVTVAAALRAAADQLDPRSAVPVHICGTLIGKPAGE